MTDPAFDLLRALVVEVRGLRADLARGRAGGPSHVALLPILAASVNGREFSAREVMDRVRRLDYDLRFALDAAGLTNARRLGKWLRTIEGHAIAGARLERIGDDRDGIIWRVWRV